MAGGWGWGGYLGNRLRFKGEQQERAIQQNSCTPWAQHIRQGRGVKSEGGREKLFLRLLHVAAVSLHTEVCYAKQ